MLQKFMDEVRDGKREGSILSTDTVQSLSLDQREAWRLVRKELEDVGITPQLFEQNRDMITKTLQDAFEAGALQESAGVSDVDSEIEESISSSGSYDSSLSLPPPRTHASMPDLDIHDTELIRQKPARSSVPRFKRTKPTRGARAKQALYFIFGRGANKDLLAAAQEGDTDLIKSCLKDGADIEATDEDGNTALALAAISEHITSVKVLLEEGANIESRNKSSNTPLSSACHKNNRTAIVEILLISGANIESRDRDEFSGLLHASSRGHGELVRLLLDKGANIEAKTSSGVTALCCACKKRQTSTVRILLEYGAKVDFEMEDRKISALWVSLLNLNYIFCTRTEQSGELARFDAGIIRLLLNAGADVTAKNLIHVTASEQLKRYGMGNLLQYATKK